MLDSSDSLEHMETSLLLPQSLDSEMEISQPESTDVKTDVTHLQTLTSQAADGSQFPSSSLESQDAEIPIVIKDIQMILEKSLKEINRKFASYVHSLCEIIKQKLSPDELRSQLLSFPAFCDHSFTKAALFKDREAELQEAKTIEEMFAILNKCYGFINYVIFEKIIEKNNVSKDQEELQYQQHLKAYIEKHKISEFMNINPRLKKLDDSTKELIVKFDVESTCKLAKVIDLQKAIANILGLDFATLQIIDIKDGCVVLTFQIPASIANIIFTPNTMFSTEQEDLFASESVLWLECNHFKFSFAKLPQAEAQELPGNLYCM